jgi:hypothetical protein
MKKSRLGTTLPMEPTMQSDIIDEMLEPFTEALTPEAARSLAALKPKPAVQARVDELAAKCNEGDLTEAERREYETYVQVGNIFALLTAKAKKIIADTSNS